MKNTHTAGPWTLKSEPYEDGTPYFIIKAGQGAYEDGAYDGGFTIRQIMGKHDAVVIASAPLVFEALNDLLGACQRYDEDPGSALTTAFYEAARDKASKVIEGVHELRSSVTGVEG